VEVTEEESSALLDHFPGEHKTNRGGSVRATPKMTKTIVVYNSDLCSHLGNNDS
jgi:hypothetical protein